MEHGHREDGGVEHDEEVAEVLDFVFVVVAFSHSLVDLFHFALVCAVAHYQQQHQHYVEDEEERHHELVDVVLLQEGEQVEVVRHCGKGGEG